MKLSLTALCAIAFAFAGTAVASAPPVGPLPKAKVTTLKTTRGSYFSVTVPVRGGGYVWRVARAYNNRVVGQVGEADVGRTIVLVFRATRRGHTSIVVAETKGETRTAYESRTFAVRIR
jgi:hypothetical protein